MPAGGFGWQGVLRVILVGSNGRCPPERNRVFKKEKQKPSLSCQLTDTIPKSNSAKRWLLDDSQHLTKRRYECV